MKAVAVQTRIQVKNIVFATDFSHAAATALPFAAEIAQRFGAKLFAVHAKTPENYALPTAELWPEANAEVEKLANELQETLHQQFPSVESQVLLAEGGVWGVIEAVAEQKKADLIVVGTNGRRGIGKFILGSVAEEILRAGQVPRSDGGSAMLHPKRPREPSSERLSTRRTSATLHRLRQRTPWRWHRNIRRTSPSCTL